MSTQFWKLSKDGDPIGFAMARRHYSAERNPNPKQRQFVGPGEKFVLIGTGDDAVFAWLRSKYRRDGQRGVNCTLFRNESGNRSSDMIREAMLLAWEKWPGERLFTFVNAEKVRSSNPGCCFLKAGWKRCGTTENGLLVFEAVPA